MAVIKIVIVDDHKIIRDGLIAILKGEKSIDVMADVSSGDELMVLLKNQTPDLILLDMHMPLKGGVEVAKEVRGTYPKMKILINTMSEIPEEIESAVNAGVNGYILKTSGSDELVKAVQMLAGGANYFGSAVVNSFIKSMRSAPVEPKRELTPTELKIIKMLVDEKKQSFILTELNINKATYITHLQNMYRKLKVKTEIGLVKFALKNNIMA